MVFHLRFQFFSFNTAVANKQSAAASPGDKINAFISPKGKAGILPGPSPSRHTRWA